jgi:hypothetical protein
MCKGKVLAKVNYSFEKRQRDLAKKSKQEEKRQRKLAGRATDEDGGPDATAAPSKDPTSTSSGAPAKDAV